MRLPQRHRIPGNAAVVEEGELHRARRIGCRGGWGEMRLPQRHRNAGNAAVVVGNFGDWEPLPFGVCWSVSLYRSLDLESLPLLLSLPSLVLEPS